MSKMLDERAQWATVGVKPDTRAQSLDYLDKYLREIAGIREELLNLIAILRAEVKGCPMCGRREADK